MSAWLDAEVIENRVWTDAVFSLRVRFACPRFEAGQFVRIALDIAGERVARPFSFVNAPAEAGAEFYGIVVPGGLLSPPLAKLKPGDRLFVADNPSGFLVLSEVPEAPTLWMLATGTGLAPFISILRDGTVWKRHQRVVLVHGVRRAAELAYREELDALAKDRPLRYLPMTSREPEREPPPGLLQGRIPAAITDGRLEAAAGALLTAEASQVMLCGNPDMLRDVQAVLTARGMKKHRRRSPGQITTEAFW